MPEITDKDLASIYPSLSSCSPLVRGLAERLRRVEKELTGWKENYCHSNDLLAEKQQKFEAIFRAEAAEEENAALRERVKRMEEALQRIAKYSEHLIGAGNIRSAAQAALKEGE